MRKFVKFLGFIIFSLFLLFLHYLISYFFPPPWKFFNIFNLFFVLYIMGWEKSNIIWVAILVYFFLELYALMPFGFTLLPGVISIMLIYILYMYIFTNRSWYSAAILAALFAWLNKAVFVLLILLYDFSSLPAPGVWPAFLGGLFWEILLTSSAAAILIFILSLKTNRFDEKRLKFEL